MLSLGIFTDLHYARGIREGSRHCHLSLQKLHLIMERFRAEGVQFVVALGDLVDSAPQPQEESGYLRAVCRELARLACPVRYVPGNHCVWSLTKDEFCAITRQNSTWGALRRGGWRLIFLDGCFRADGVPYGARNNDWRDANVSAEQVQWLKDELSLPMPTAVFIHQRLDAPPPYGVANAGEIRTLLESCGCVKHVFQGHQHPGDSSTVSGITYITLPAVCEGSDVTAPPYLVVRLP